MASVPIRIESFATVDAFLARTSPFLETREAEHNLLFGIASHVRTDPNAYGPRPPVFAAAEVDGRVVAAAMRTPPWNLIVSLVDEPRAIAALADHVATTDPDVPGVNGPASVAPDLAAAIGERTGRGTRVVLEERIYRLSRVIPPRPAPGSMRVARADDRPLIASWLLDFGAEALPHQDPPDADLLADRWIQAVGRTMYLWEDERQVVSLTGTGGATPNGIRVGPVYTPPALRGRGYASNLVAAASQAQLDAGRRFVFLFTDLANPTSNAIYQRIGYEPVSDVLEVGLVPRA